MIKKLLLYLLLELYFLLCHSILPSDSTFQLLLPKNDPPKILRVSSDRDVFSGSELTIAVISKPECEQFDVDLQLAGIARTAASLFRFVHLHDNQGMNAWIKSCPQIALIPINATGWEQAHFYDYDINDLRTFISWFNYIVNIDVEIYNPQEYTVELYWIQEEKEEELTQIIQPNEDVRFRSFVGHIFVARRSSDKKMINFWVMNGSPKYVIDTLPDCPEEQENLAICERAEKKMEKVAYNFWYEQRKWLNYFQPKIVPAFTPLGFEKRKIPIETWKWLKEFYENQLSSEQLEVHVGICLNQHKAPSYLIELGSAEKQRLVTELQPILSEWAGTNLKETSCYGIRKYTNGSLLQMHVDTLRTHVISAIINVDQKVDEDWLLQIVDHNGNVHQISMQAGEMVLYESAKALHGRYIPLKGEFYSNIFLHFMPTHGWNYDWV